PAIHHFQTVHVLLGTLPAVRNFQSHKICDVTNKRSAERRSAAPSVAAQRRSLVPLAGIEPALLAELDFESSASTSSATGAFVTPGPRNGRALRSRRNIAGGNRRSTRAYVIAPHLDSAARAR